MEVLGHRVRPLSVTPDSHQAGIRLCEEGQGVLAPRNCGIGVGGWGGGSSLRLTAGSPQKALEMEPSLPKGYVRELPWNRLGVG